MVKCKVFCTCWERTSHGTCCTGPEFAFNDFCKENPDIDIIHIETIARGHDHNDISIYLYYNEKETTHSECTDSTSDTIEDFNDAIVQNFKPGDKVIYRNKYQSYNAIIVRTGLKECIVSYFDDWGSAHIQQTQYAYISNLEE